MSENKKDKPLKINKSFPEALARIVRVDKKQVEKNIKNSKKDSK